MNSRKLSTRMLPLLLTVCLLMAGCGSTSSGAKNAGKAVVENSPAQSSQEVESGSDATSETSAPASRTTPVSQTPVRSANSFPDYSGKAYAVINNNVPEFSESDLTTTSYETYGELDSLGRCTTCIASIGKDLMPTGERGSIGMVKPTGWHTAKYDWIEGKYLYNRCHLIGYQLTAENANKQNLITGTRYLNVDGMLPFENMTADYIKETGNHVLYRVTPVFDGQNLVASGVHMEAESVEDHGEGVMFNIYCYNIQGGVSIDYTTGESHAAEESSASSSSSTGTNASQISDAGNNTASDSAQTSNAENSTGSENEASSSADTSAIAADSPVQSADTSAANTNTSAAAYIVNTNTHKFHLPGCRAITQMNEEHKLEESGTREEMLAKGYESCGICKS